jgi:hypothetical protein
MLAVCPWLALGARKAAHAFVTVAKSVHELRLVEPVAHGVDDFLREVLCKRIAVSF